MAPGGRSGRARQGLAFGGERSHHLDFAIPDDGAVAYGATCDVERAVTTHLFGISPNNSGSTFLQRALATCRATWNLPDEGYWVAGYSGPTPGTRRFKPGDFPLGHLWTADRRMLDRLTDPDAYDWPRTRKAWYFHAYARDPEASVFYTKSPPHLLIVDELARHFRNAKFLFMVRDPYAVCEGIIRLYRDYAPRRYEAVRILFPNRTLPELAAAHVAACLAWQRRNVEAHGGRAEGRGAFFTYEEMCAGPERVEHRIRTLVPALGDLRLRRKLPVKHRHHEMLTDMNARQIARLDAAERAECTRVFRERRDVLDYFGYDLR